MRLLFAILAAFVALSSQPLMAAADTLLVSPVSSTAVEGSRIFKTAPGNLYRLSVTTGGTAGYLMVFDSTSVPAEGAVTPAVCRVVAANSTLTISLADPTARFGNGIVAVFSSTGCFTKTISATAYFEGYFQ